MMHGILKTPYPKFSEMPSDEQEIWLKQFAQDFTWHRDFTNDVRKAFKKIAAKHYSYTLHEWKRKWIRGKMPKGANQEVFNGLIRYWGKPETISLSKKNSKNRKSNRGGLGIATQNAGATSASSRQRQLTVRDGVVPDNLTLMEDMNTNKETKQVQDGRAKMVLENVKA
ncbi:uncharacterized protein LOC9323021 [Arabidopsis lyrata subsp. lyrata]|nr:uncharacterized protein LOC9323021 [Arabidopsis lyrata subsp. lyrata]|eukprot:XP_020891448.1 uncharacterized protein LOC9323021 [Arabidopsis lyrata subsp. lyrata]